MALISRRLLFSTMWGAGLAVGLSSKTEAQSEIAPESASTPALASPARARAVSPAMAEKLLLNAPKFVPPKPEGEKAPELPDRRELDKPKNGIIRLPNYVVREPKPPTFPERELLTPQGKLDLAYKRHPGLRLGSLPFLSNDRIALFMLEEEHHLERLAEMNELFSILRAGNDSDTAKVKAQTEASFIRKNDWATNGGSWQQSHPNP
jgi:hypothetical protein